MKIYPENILLLLLVLVFASSCDDKSDCRYEPSPATPENCMTVYFDSSNCSEFIFEPGEATSVELTLSRLDATQAAEVPLKCLTADEGLTLPTVASFEAGQHTTTVAVSFGELEISRKYSFTLAIDDAYVDHYTQLDGSSIYKGFVLAASWHVYASEVTMTWTVQGTQYTFNTQLEQLGTINRYRFADFVGSGLDMVFTTGGTSVYEGYDRIEPYSNYEDYDDGYANAFYFMDSEMQDYPSWTVGNTTILYLCIMREYYGYGDYSYISLDKRGGRFGTYFTDYDDGTSDAYNYIDFAWTQENEK